MKKIYLVSILFFLIFQTTSAQLIINEVLYDPPSGLAGDANGDGTRDAIDDEFIEFVNNSSSSLDVSGYKIYDVTVADNSRTLRHTIPDNTILPPYGVLVIFGGGTPTGNFGGATVITDTGSAGLSLNNSDERIEVDSASDVLLLTFDSDALSNNPDESYSRFPDITGNFVQHEQDASTDGITTALFSPGTMITVTTWTGNGDTDTDWDTATNWSNGVPTSVGTAIVPNLTNDPVAAGAVSVFSMLIEANASTDISGALNNTGVVSLNSGATLISKLSASGNITYNRSLATDNWYLVSSPVTGEAVVDFLNNHSFVTGSGTSPNQNVGLAPYDNNQASASDRWQYYVDGDFDGAPDTSDMMSSGLGFSTKLSSAGTISFTGSMPVADMPISITSNSTTFNLIGNPYPSFIPGNDPADGNSANDDDILSVNSTSLTEQTLWLWNQATNSYDEVNQATSGKYIAPGQAFFVSSTGSNTFNINEAMQSHQSADTFQKSADIRTEIQLTLSNESQTKETDIFYIDGTSNGFDNGYDSSLFGGVTSSFSLFTHLVANGNGEKLGVQSLPNSGFENMVIPVGLKSNKGTIKFRAITKNLPSDIKVFLEDRHTNTFTRLDKQSNEYIVELDKEVNGIGRFYLHTKSTVLSNSEFNLENISIYKTNLSSIRIVGLSQGKSSIKIFDVLGKEIINKIFISDGLDDIILPSKIKGIYFIQLKNKEGKLNRKVILD